MKKINKDLKYLVRNPLDLTSPSPLLILLHGYGSNEKALFSIAKKVPKNWFVVSIRAPFSITKTQYKWYNGDLVAGKIVIDRVTEKQSRKALIKFIDQFVKEHNVDKKKVVTAGFSQGASVALSLALIKPKMIHATACFSGLVMEQIDPNIKASKALQSKNVFIGYGTEDNRAHLKNIEENINWLEAFGMKITSNTYKMWYTIVSQEIDDFIVWLEAL